MFKKILIYILISSLIFITSGCKRDGVKYIEVKERVPYNVVEAELVHYDEDILFEDADLIFKGKVISEKEIGLKEYKYGELRHIYYLDVFTFKVEEVYYPVDSSLKNGDIIRVANASCSNNWYKGTIKMEKGKEYILLTKKSYDTKTVDFSKYFDYAVVTHWMAIISVEDDNYIFDEVFTSLKESTDEEIIREDNGFKTKMYSKGKEFEKELKDLISKKKGKE